MDSHRFYPDDIAPFPYEPTRDRFSIVFLDDQIGQGVMTHVPFRAGEIVFAFTGTVLDEITQFSLQLPDGHHLHDPHFMGKVLHHCDPNCTVDMTRCVFIARRTILPDEFVTMDYAETEDVLFRTFDCQCNAPNCRGHVTGRLQVR